MRSLILSSLIILNMLNAVDCLAQDAPKVEPMVNHTPLLKSTDYQPPKPLKRKFSFGRLAKHICLAPVNILTACGNPYGYEYGGYYPSSYGGCGYYPTVSNPALTAPSASVNYPGIAGVGYQPLPDGSWIGPGNPGWHH